MALSDSLYGDFEVQTGRFWNVEHHFSLPQTTKQLKLTSSSKNELQNPLFMTPGVLNTWCNWTSIKSLSLFESLYIYHIIFQKFLAGSDEL